jgi:hypothetical protein
VAAAQTVNLAFTDQGAGAFTQDSFTVYRGGTPANMGITLTETWISSQWLVDGEGRGTGSGFTVSAGDYSIGGHTLQVLVYDGAKYWSRTITFIVSY